MSERLYSKFESVGTPAHVNVQEPKDELELECLASRLRRNVWQTVVSKMFGKPCDEVAVCA